MKRIKPFNIFESYQSANDIMEKRIREISDVYEDARSIVYILEEDGYKVEWKLISGIFSYSIKGDISECILRNSHMIGRDLLSKVVSIRINIPGIGGRNREDARTDMQRFKVLLEDHLDYLPEGSLELVDGGFYYKIYINI